MTDALRVILNDRVLYRPLTGVGHYVSQLLAGLRRARGVDVQPFLGRWLPARNGSVGGKARLDGSGLRNAWWVRRLMQATYGAAFRMSARGFALYHEPNHIPITSDIPTVTTIHDLSVLVHPEWHPEDRVRWYEAGFEAGRRQTRRFLAASSYTKGEMVRLLGIPAQQIDVTYQAPRDSFRPQPPEIVAQTLRECGLPERFYLYVGTLEPRKNLAGLIAAYAALAAEVRARYALVLAGGRGWKMDALEDQLRRHGVRDTTYLLGYLEDARLAALYTACTALVWPSFYEGFGLPPLEAMTCGAAVITSDVTSLPEVVGEAGITLPPADTARWADCMTRMALDADWRERWRTLGRARAALFSWERCAAETIACYEAALRG